MTKLTEQMKRQVVEAAEAYMSVHNLSNGQFAKDVAAVSTSYFSYMVNRNWNGMPHGSDPSKTVAIADKYFERVADAIGLKLERQYWGHLDTDNYRLMVATFNDARADRLPHCIDGETGQGKSYAAEAYKRMHPANTFVVTCADDLTSKSFMVELALAVGVKPVGAIYEIRRAVQKKLMNVVNPLLIIDESENLKDRAWGASKALMDNMKGYCGMVFIGANDFRTVMEKKADKGLKCFPQVYSRLKEGGFTPLFGLSAEDVRDIAGSFGITSQRVVNKLHAMCRNMRELSGAVQKLLRESEAMKAPVDADLFDTVIG
jgi:DNA transposition AAA+ family ATPase